MLKTNLTLAATLATATLVPVSVQAAAYWHTRHHHTGAHARFGGWHSHVGYRHTAYGGGLRRSRDATDFVGGQNAQGSGGLVGRASFYSGGGHTANGGAVGPATCAHRSLPFGTKILVTNLANARQAVLTVNDRGPFVRGRMLDVSRGAAGLLGMLHAGVSQIRMQVLGGAG